MKIKSLAFKTDLFFHRFSGIVQDLGDYLVVKTPENPNYFWGNLIYFSKPPAANSLIIWKQIYCDHFEAMNTEHITFGWDSSEGDEGEIAPFLVDGFKLEKSLVMRAQNIYAPIKIFNELIVRPIESDLEWDMVIENQVLSRADTFLERPFRQFTIRKISSYRAMIERNKGQWFGAFIDGRLVGDLGIFVENGLGRLQVVGTNPDYRRQGVCSTLVYKSCLYAIEKMAVTEFIIVADPEYFAFKIYESIGFIESEMQIGLCKFNKTVWVT
jgi:ribosomal protein S18 acetylase RimI-like enzyme